MPSQWKLGVATAVFAALITTPTHAADIYVKAGASGKGSKDNPYGALWKAVDRAKRGDVIHVAAGTYNGKGGNGHFIPKVPNLTMAGGYTADFSSRDPFKNLTILERAEDYRGDWTGLPEGIIQGDNQKDHSDLIVDGFVLNAKTRNVYGPNKINPKKSYKGSLFKANSKNTKIRNCILLNNYGNGIYCTWSGTENEVSNNIIVNNFYVGISTRSAQPDSVINIKNNTIAFLWFQPGKGGSIGVFTGSQGQTILDGNVLSFLQTEDGGAGHGVMNTFANEDTIMKNNVFFACSGGFYKYMDDNRANLLVWKNDELEELNDEDDCEDFMLLESGDNREADPGLKPNKAYASIFANFMGSAPGKLNIDDMNKWRRAMGMPLQAEKGSARSNWAPAYPVDQVVPNMISKIKGVGAQSSGPFEAYKSAAEAAEKSYEDAEFAIFKKGAATALNGKDVKFKAGIGKSKTEWLLKQAPRSDYSCYLLLLPGKKWPTRDYAFGYFLKGSEAEQKWLKYSKKADKYNKKGGVTLTGTAFYVGKDTYAYPTGIIVDKVSRK